MLEKQIEKLSVQRAKAEGWYSRKFSSPSHRGVPDRIFIKAGVVVFIELKTATGKVSKLQQKELEDLNNHGVHAVVCRSVDEVMSTLHAAEEGL